MNEQYVISGALAQAILDYLVTQPYGQVFKLVAGLQHLAKVPPPAEEEEKPA